LKNSLTKRCSWKINILKNFRPNLKKSPNRLSIFSIKFTLSLVKFNSSNTSKQMEEDLTKKIILKTICTSDNQLLQICKMIYVRYRRKTKVNQVNLIINLTRTWPNSTILAPQTELRCLMNIYSTLKRNMRNNQLKLLMRNQIADFKTNPLTSAIKKLTIWCQNQTL